MKTVSMLTSTFEPAHLLLGVCKLCDLPWDALRVASPGADAAIQCELEADIKALQHMSQRAGLDQTAHESCEDATAPRLVTAQLGTGSHY